MLTALIITSISLLPAQSEGFSRGSVNWHSGDFASALAAAKERNELLLVEFWANWCSWCRLHESMNLSDDKVLAAFSEYTCMGADVSQDENGEFVDPEAADLMRLFSVQSFPTLIFIRPDGTAEDIISGYMPSKPLTKEINRIKQGKDTVSFFERMAKRHPADLEWRFKLGMKLGEVGDQAGYDREIASIRKLDPRGLSLPMRRLSLGNLREVLGGCLRDPALSPDPTQLEAFIAAETSNELLSDAWLMMAAVHKELGSMPKTLSAYRKAWKHATDLQRPNVGNSVAYALWNLREEISREDKRLALRISLRATTLFQNVNFDDTREAEYLDTLACCYFMNGKLKRSLNVVEECLRLDADNPLYLDRLRSFSKPN